MNVPAASLAAKCAGGRGHWRVYLTIFRQLSVASWLLSGWTLLYPIVLVATQLFASARLATIVFGVSWLALFLVGFGLGYTTSGLWGQDSQRLVPDYHRRLMRVATVTALAIWSVIPLTYWLGSIDRDGIPWVDGVWLWSYGLLGLSFIWGFFVTRKAHWLVRAAMTSLALFPVALMSYAPFREWLFSPLAPSLPGHTPINLLSLLLGPHNWPLFFARRMPAIQEAALLSGQASIQQRVRTGTALDGFVMQELLYFFHTKSRLRPEFLVFPPALPGWLWGPLAMALFVGVFAKAGILDLTIVGRTTLAPLMALLTAIAPLSASVGRKSLGRYTLLPGAVHRRELPTWLTRRYFAVCAAAIAFLWLPSLLVAVWAEVPAAAIGRFIAALLLSLAGATALQLFVLPGKTAVLSPLKVLLSVFVGIIAAVNAALIVNDARAPLMFAGVAVSVTTSTILYLWGLRRWKTIDLGG